MGVASITKTFVAAEVMLLAKAGQVDLDAPISTYVNNKLTANNATVRHHLAMLSGVPNYLPADYGWMDTAIKAAPAKHWTAEQALSYYTAPIGQPGSAYNYSNPSYVVLGQLIEKVTGQPLASVLRKQLATPAGLQRAAFQDGEKPQPPLAGDANPVCGKADDGYLPCRAIASLSAANGGLAADAPTVARWGYQLYGGRVIPAELVGEMTKGDGEYGLGTMLFTQRFGIGTAFGHRGVMPDYTSLLVVIPAKKVSVALLLADGNKQVDTAMTELTAALQPLLT
jgi:D-alanyl-D-alanine carboxypeptidase